MSGYSARWRSVFDGADPARTQADVALLTRVLPLPEYRRVLDVPCGTGRHVAALTAIGYDVLGVDNDPAVSPAVVLDLRELESLPTDFDGVINMWASFGYFDPETNEAVLASLSHRLRPGGRLVFDLFNGAFFASRRDVERQVRPGILERSRVTGNRRRVELVYGDGQPDVFEWQLYRAEELEAIGVRHGLRPVHRVASDDEATMQLVLQRDA